MNRATTTRSKCWCGIVAAAGLLATPALGGGFVYETPLELITTGDFNGDGLADVVIVDRATGNARVGYQTPAGAIAWGTSPQTTGVPNPTAIAAGRWFVSGREALAVTSPEFNKIQLLELAPATNRAAFAPGGTGPNLLISLRNPQGSVDTAPFDWVAAGSRGSDPGITILELFAFVGDGISDLQDALAQESYVSSGNAFVAGGVNATLAAAMLRGSNDTFAIYSFINLTRFALGRSNLTAGTEYVFGRFNNEPQPRILFFVPGESNVIVQPLVENAGVFGFGAAVVNTFTAAVQRVYYVDEGTNGLAMVQFGDGIRGARVAAGGSLIETYQFGAGAGFAPSAVVSLGNTRFALLSAPTNGTASTTSATFERSGANYVSISSSNLPPATTRSTRANVWLFANEPFVQSSPVFVSSLNGGDWVSAVMGLPGSLSVTSEDDRGPSSGLGDATSESLPSPPNTAIFALGNQYHPAISLFSYASARPPQPALVVISPPPGHYPAPVQISFTTSNNSDHVYYRVGDSAFQPYFVPFTLGTNTQVQYYGENTSTAERTVLQVARYTFDDNSFAPLVTTNGNGTNNVPAQPPVATNGLPTYAYGTLFYSRRTGTNGAIWSITLDGANDRFLTEGTRPRLSPDGRYLAFLRGGRPFETVPQNNGDIWIRDLLTGAERILVPHTNLIVGFDWEFGNTNLVFDHGCGMFRTDLGGNVTPLPFAIQCPEDAPAVSPIDGRIAFHAVAPLATNRSIFVTDAALSLKQDLNLPLLRPRRPAWSPDGDQLALSDYAFTFLPESPMNLYVVNPDGTELFQITGFTQIEGFREGALWTPNADGLIGAATIGGVNGIWLVPLTADRHACGSPPVRLPTTPGDDIDFVGTVFVPPAPPRLVIRREQGGVIVLWPRTAWPYVLQVTSELSPTAAWTDIAPPYAINSRQFEVHIPAVSAQQNAFFRLRRP